MTKGSYSIHSVLMRRCRKREHAAQMSLRSVLCLVCLTVKPVGEPDAGNPHVRFDERGWETERCRMAQATAPILDSTIASHRARAVGVCLLGAKRTAMLRRGNAGF